MVQGSNSVTYYNQITRENIREALSDTDIGKDFLENIPEVQALNRK